MIVLTVAYGELLVGSTALIGLRSSEPPPTWTKRRRQVNNRRGIPRRGGRKGARYRRALPIETVMATVTATSIALPERHTSQ